MGPDERHEREEEGARFEVMKATSAFVTLTNGWRASSNSPADRSLHFDKATHKPVDPMAAGTC